MKRICNLIAIVLLLSISRASGFVKIDQNGDSRDSFAVEFKGVKILEHSEARPLLSVGLGSFEAVENQGNFVIDDEITSKLALDKANFDQTEDETIIELSSSEEDGVKVALVLFENVEGQLEIRLDLEKSQIPEYNLWFLRLPASQNEYIWGGGEQFTYLNLRQGGTYPIWTREQGVGRNKSSPLTQIVDMVAGAGGDYHTTYWPQPSFLSSRGYHFESTYPTYSELRLLPLDEDVNKGHEIYWHYSPNYDHPCVTCKLVFTVEPSLMQIAQKINPGQPELPEWTYNGAILGVQGGTERMLEILDRAKNAQVAVSGLWIQDWSGKIVTEFGSRVFWNWQWNSTWYPDLDVVIQDLLNEDIRVTAYITPHLNTDGSIYKELEDSQYWLTSNDDSSTLIQDFGQFNVSTVDILKQDPECNCLNPARIWYKELIKSNLIGMGFSGWMADFGEYTPTHGSTHFDGRWWGNEAGEILHSFISQHWASLNREAIEEAGKLGEILFWMRSGGIDSKHHQVMSWAGDQTVDWTKSDGLPSSIIAALSLAVSGMGLSHSDIGGYTSLPQLGPIAPIRDQELLLRWAEYSVFTPLMRTHEGNRPEENAQVYDDRETLEKFGRLTRIHVDLGPYIKIAVSQNALQGIPVMRPLFLMFENDETGYDHEHQYMFGDDILVAPVLEPGVQEWKVYLPGPCDWIWFWDTQDEPEVITGQQNVTTHAPMGLPPVFYKASSIYKDLFRQIAMNYQ